MTMKSILKSVVSILTDIKIYISRTVSWISVMNSLMLVFLVIERLSSMGIVKSDLGNSFVFVVIAWFIILVVLGWIEVKKLRAPHIEAAKMLKLNPPMQQAFIRIKEIDERTKKMEEDIKRLNK